MDIIYKYRFNCVNSTNESYVEKWTDNQTTDTVINVGPLSYVPNLIYTDYGNGIYEWCGPLLLVAEYFAKFSKLRFILK